MCVWTGKPVWGESGELVCLKPIPCQPTHFWNDENGSKYHKAYFSTYPGKHRNISRIHKPTYCLHTNNICYYMITLNIFSSSSFHCFNCGLMVQHLFLMFIYFRLGVWAHGDYCKINPKTGGVVMLGRRSAFRKQCVITYSLKGAVCRRLGGSISRNIK